MPLAPFVRWLRRLRRYQRGRCQAPGLARTRGAAMKPTTLYRTQAPFMVRGQWQWHRWNHSEPCAHAACWAKRNELGAHAHDMGQVTHEEESRWNHAPQR